jgi:hypothetical protein
VVGVDSTQKVRQQTPVLQADLHRDILLTRREARASGQKRLEEELERTLIATTLFATDDAAGVASSAVLAGAWAATALAAIGADASLRELAGLAKAIDGRVRRVAVTESAQAFNAERHALLIDLDLGRANREPFDEKGPPPPGMFKVWSAILDRVTCPRCFAADGQVVELHKPFKSGESPPLHPFCRCIIEHVIVPKPQRLDDIAIDYELFKEELRDVIREGRGISDKRALAFVSDSLGRGNDRSPKALTKRFANEDYATRR